MALVPDTKNLITLKTPKGEITLRNLEDLKEAYEAGFIDERVIKLATAACKHLFKTGGGSLTLDDGQAKVDAPEGVHVLDKPRIGDEVKDKYIGHVHEAFAQGYLDEPEHDARVEAMMAARTGDELAFLTLDLPEKLKVIEPASKVPAKKKARREVFTRNECVFWGVLCLINLINLLHEHNTPFAALFAGLWVAFLFMFAKKSR